MNRQDKLNVLNSLFLKDWDSSGNVIDYIYIENTNENVQKLQQIGVPAEEITAKTDSEGIEIASFVFSYGEAEWLSETGEFLDYTP